MKPLLVGILLLSLLLCVACLPQKLQLIKQDLVIESDTTWSGDVRISGVVTVKKTATLTILPGTRILFERHDRDGDGVGDGELLIEGRLLARGTGNQPILLSSAEPHPQAADWKYLYLDFARESLLEHVIAEYAYSGVQIHFSRARVLNSEFRYNVDGIRFSTVNLEVSGCRIHHNQHGIRYEERRSQVHVHHNDIRKNDIGLFVVTRSEDRAVFEYNNIVDSRNYAVKLGLQQQHDVSLPRNWWGTTDPEQIAAQFLDYSTDDQLGRVLIPERLTTPLVLPQDNP